MVTRTKSKEMKPPFHGTCFLKQKYKTFSRVNVETEVKVSVSFVF